MIILGIDFETTGLDTKNDSIIEIGAALFNAAAGWQPKLTLSALIKYDKPISLSEEVKEVTGITDEELERNGKPLEFVLGILEDMVAEADYIMAHNSEFDEQMLKNQLRRMGLQEKFPKCAESPKWLCSLSDIEHPDKFRCRKLAHLSLDYGVTVNPKVLHRALDDVLLMGKMMKERGTSIQEDIEFAQEPWIYVRALIPPPWEDGGKGRDQAKASGFGWERAPGTQEPVYPKCWVKRTKKKNFVKEVEAMKPYRLGEV